MSGMSLSELLALMPEHRRVDPAPSKCRASKPDKRKRKRVRKARRKNRA